MRHQAIIRHFIVALLLLMLPADTQLYAQQARDGDPAYRALRRELLKMINEDQKHRNELTELMKNGAGPEGDSAWKKMAALSRKQEKIDRNNLKRIEQIIARYGWPTRSMVGTEASEATFLIIQHADLLYQKRYFPLLKAAVARGEARPDHAAMMEDRILMREGKKQIYGTGLHTNDVTRVLELWPIENEEEVDARRAAVGLPPMAEFLKVVGLEYTPPKKKN